MLIATPSQTVGPYFRLGMDALNHAHVAPEDSDGLIAVQGQLVDGDGAPIPDCVLEVWQADRRGQYAFIEGQRNPLADPNWRGFARVPTGPDGRFIFYTVRPGAVPDRQGDPQAPHAVVMIGMRGLLKFLMTRFYFPGPELDADALLSSIEPSRRETLIGKAASAVSLTWNLKVQGAGETVFFDY